MTRKASLALCAILLLIMSALVLPAGSSHPAIFAMDFSGFPGGTVLRWLGSKGFVPKQDASNASKVVYFSRGNELRLETKTRAFGVLLNEADVGGYS